MNALIIIEKDQDIVEKDHHIHNNSKQKIAQEVRVLTNELRRIGVLDKKSI